MKKPLAGNSEKKKPRGRPFQPGQSGNPVGRPKGPGLTQMLIEALEKKNEAGKTYAEMLVLRVVQKAIGDGDAKLIDFIWDRVEGKVTQAFEHSGKMTLEQLVQASFEPAK